MEQFRVAIVVPAFNEAGSISKQIAKLSKYGHVIVVNDGSTDNTKEICEKSPCRIINLDSNRGYDHALEVGIKACLNYDFVITTDADGEIPTDSVQMVKDKLNSGYDCVIGVRDHYPRIGEQIVNRVVFKNFEIKDIFCGLKGYRTSAIPSEFTLANSIGTKLALVFFKKNKKIGTIPVKIHARTGNSRFGKNDLKTNYKLLKVLKYVI